MQTELQILYHSNGLIAVNKAPGLAVHAAPGPGGSVLKSLLAQTGLCDLTPVHRLDKDASGVLVFAESTQLAAEIQRTWDKSEKEYLALCDGMCESREGQIDALILEHQTGKPERMRNAVRYFEKQNPGIVLPPLPAPKTSGVHPAGRASETAYAVVEAFGEFTLFRVIPKQGRMHQIRVHLAHLGHPLAVDPLYGKRSVLRHCDAGGNGAEVLLSRMPLHAETLRFSLGNERIEIHAPLPEDMVEAIRYLKARG